MDQDNTELLKFKKYIVARVYNNISQDINNKEFFIEKTFSSFCQFSSTSNIRLDSFELFIASKNSEKECASYKPWNCIFNWRKLFITIPKIAMDVAAAAELPWLIPFTALLISNEIISQFEIKLSHRHGITMMVLWNLNGANNYISKNKILVEINQFLNREKLETMSNSELKIILNDLLKLKAIEKKGSKIMLQEYVICL